MRLRARLGAIACAVSSVAAHSAAQEPATAQDGAAAPNNVVVIVIDTLRADRLSCYGHPRTTTPQIDRLAARGLRFARAYGTAPWTLPSTTSLMSGLQPDVHRATGFLAPISADARLLAQQLAERGFETAAFIGNYFMQPLFGFDRGFASYNGDCMVDRAGINSDRISDHAIAWLEQPHARPFLLYLHYFDPHYNYWEHAGFAFDGPGAEDTDRVFSGEDIYELRAHLPDFDAADRARLDALYDSEVAFTDHHVGRVLAKLDELGLAGRTLVVVTADHGEALGEHGWIGHTIQLYEESVRIPLIVAGPGIEPGVRDGDPVQLDDLLAPLLQLASGQRDAGAAAFTSAAAGLDRGLLADEALLSVQITGIDEPGDARPRKITNLGAWRLFVDRDANGDELYRLFKTDEPKGKRRKRPEDFPGEMKQLLEARAEELEARRRELAKGRAVVTRRRALVKGSFKLIVDEVADRAELYDLANDPAERSDLAAARPDAVAVLKRRLQEIVSALATAALAGGAEISGEAADEARRRIEQIGYGKH